MSAPGRIDLHSHSLASDGQYPAAEVAVLARRAGLGTWALCDHDTVAGLASGAAAAAREGLRFVPGIELSAFLERREIHLLGHFVDPAHPALVAFEDFLAVHRRERVRQIVVRLAALGVSVTEEAIERHSGGKTIGRPHVARAIVETGAVATVREAFDRWLGEGQPAYVQRYRLEAADAVALVRGAGGTVTIAHPGVSKLEVAEVARLAEAGVSGIEVIHPDQNPSVRDKYARAAAASGLVMTAGSDYHGPDVTPDRQLGMVTMDQAALAALEARRP
ncbi:MAG: PHP domain-containing protein [Anaeromyxobacter sp.]|nr:PHP domain-containing protein [Anaeromyxobacter sp.]MBL0276833.1 PHP domain-containing protein [Anaeromyxobacter sp.]